MDPDPDPFLNDFKDARKIIFVIFFLKTYPQEIIFSLKNLFFCTFFVLKCYLFCELYLSPLNTFMKKEKESDPYPYL
jgi:hypothetical protein